MSIKSYIIRAALNFLWKRYPYMMMDIVIPEGSHVHRNPKKSTKTDKGGRP